MLPGEFLAVGCCLRESPFPLGMCPLPESCPSTSGWPCTCVQAGSRNWAQPVKKRRKCSLEGDAVVVSQGGA